MKTIRATFIGLALTVTTALAIGGTIFGAYDCGQWFKKQEVAKAWLLGYLSGMNGMVADDKLKYDPLGKLNSAEQAFLWMGNYCRQNPLKTVEDGGAQLYLELQKLVK